MLGLGAKLALSLVYTRQVDSMFKAMIVAAEIDMNNNFEIIYMILGYLVTMDTLYENIKSVIKPKRYNMINTKPNILFSKIFLGEISNNSTIRYTVNSDKGLKIL